MNKFEQVQEGVLMCVGGGAEMELDRGFLSEQVCTGVGKVSLNNLNLIDRHD